MPFGSKKNKDKKKERASEPVKQQDYMQPTHAFSRPYSLMHDAPTAHDPNRRSRSSSESSAVSDISARLTSLDYRDYRTSSVGPPASPVSPTDHRRAYVQGTCIRDGKVYANEVTGFYVHTAEAGSANVTVNVTDSVGEQVTVDVTRMDNGVYECSFTPVLTGLHSVFVAFGLMNLKGSPFHVDVQPERDIPKGLPPEPPCDPPPSNTGQVQMRNRQPQRKNTFHPPPIRSTAGIWQQLSEDLRKKLEGSLLKDAQIHIGNSLGEGEFGAVYEVRYTLKGKGASVAAAKTVKSSKINPIQLEEFFKEAELMSNFNHPNVLELIGVIIAEDVPYILFPVMKYGTLKEYLERNSQGLVLGELLSFGEQIACGMSYISGLKFVHRDLAARNCLLSVDLVVKISDFGLARDNFKANYTMVNKQKALPLRWMAPEILETWTFTLETDVWAFGILLWEIFAYGENPYGRTDDHFLVSMLKAGTRLEQPQAAPEDVYNIMKSCWNMEPTKRPNFTQLHQRLKSVDRIQYKNVKKAETLL